MSEWKVAHLRDAGSMQRHAQVPNSKLDRCTAGKSNRVGNSRLDLGAGNKTADPLKQRGKRKATRRGGDGRPATHERAVDGSEETDDSASASRRDVGVLLGGCGDARHFFATLIAAGDPSRCPEPSALRLRVVLNDYLCEAIARVYILLVFLDRAIATTPDVSGAPADLTARGTAAVMTFWHVYQSPTLCQPIYEELRAVLEHAAASPTPPLEWVDCTPGTWDELREVFRDWASHGLTLKQEAKQFAYVTGEMAAAQGGNLKPQVRSVRHGACAVHVTVSCFWSRGVGFLQYAANQLLVLVLLKRGVVVIILNGAVVVINLNGIGVVIIMIVAVVSSACYSQTTGTVTTFTSIRSSEVMQADRGDGAAKLISAINDLSDEKLIALANEAMSQQKMQLQHMSADQLRKLLIEQVIQENDGINPSLVQLCPPHRCEKRERGAAQAPAT
jgi:Domain of unknown function (DUF4470)